MQTYSSEAPYIIRGRVDRSAITTRSDVERGEIDPSFVVTHRLPLHDAAKGYAMFNDKVDGCEKVILQAA